MEQRTRICCESHTRRYFHCTTRLTNLLQLLILTPVLLIAFIGWSIWMGPRAMLPAPLFRSRHLWYVQEVERRSIIP
jgi:hypothetical protein